MYSASPNEFGYFRFNCNDFELLFGSDVAVTMLCYRVMLGSPLFVAQRNTGLQLRF